ncbi:MAG: sigma 54-interacting transcriptional regulator [Myxococcota bacterium]
MARTLEVRTVAPPDMDDPQRRETALLSPADATAAPAPLRLLVIGDGVVATHPLPREGDVVIGRAQDVDVQVDDASISRRHAVLHLGGSIRLEDLGSANGTRVRGSAVAQGTPVEVGTGEVIDLGSVMVIVQRGVTGARPRRLATHGYFEGRLEDERERNTPFAVLRIHAPQMLGSEAMQEILTLRGHPQDVVAYYGPGQYECLLVGCTATQAKQVEDDVTARLARHGARVRTGVACFPTDGREPEELLTRAGAALRKRAAAATPGSPIMPQGGAMQKLHRLVEKVAAGNINVLILGETGVGKEVLAEMLHRQSPRASKPFLRLNCAALSEFLLESELFGHEKGAFTGAVAAKPGLLETAQGGTVFLDELGEMPLVTQVKLLRVIEERMVTRVGGLKAQPINVRFIAATNRDLEAEIARGTFRQDLYFRLNAVTLTIPALRERTEEIEDLANAFVAQACEEMDRKDVPTISHDALELLQDYHWPGNIRELRNVMERAVLFCDGVIMREHLPVEKMEASMVATQASFSSSRGAAADGGGGANLRGEMEALERERIREALDRFAGNQTQAAKALGIPRRTLVKRLEAYGLPRPRKAPQRS